MSEQADPVIACDLTVMNAQEREQHFLTVHELFASVLEVQERPDGYAFRLPTESLTLRSAAEFIANERLCCPFFEFTLKVEPQQAGLWLWLTGSAEVKPFIHATFRELLSTDMLSALVDQ